MTEEHKQEYNKLLSRAAAQSLRPIEQQKLNELSKISINSRRHSFDYQWDMPVNQVDMDEFKRKVTISSKIDDKIIVSQIDFQNNMVYITQDVNLIFKGDIDTFKRQVAEMPDSVYEKSYKEMLSLAEDVESVLSTGITKK